MKAVTRLKPKPKFGDWRASAAALPPPIFPADTVVMARAASIMHGIEEQRAGGRLCIGHARDLIAWADAIPAPPPSLLRRALSRIFRTH